MECRLDLKRENDCGDDDDDDYDDDDDNDGGTAADEQAIKRAIATLQSHCYAR